MHCTPKRRNSYIHVFLVYTCMYKLRKYVILFPKIIKIRQYKIVNDYANRIRKFKSLLCTITQTIYCVYVFVKLK